MYKDLGKILNVSFLKIVLGDILQSNGKGISMQTSKKGEDKYVRIDLVMRYQINVTHKERKSGNTNTKQSRIQGRNIKWDKTGYFIIINNESHKEVIITEPLQPQNNSDRLPQS